MSAINPSVDRVYDDSRGPTSVGNYERYSLARDNTGNPQLITYVGTYASASEIPPAESLKTRAGQLIDEYPLLKGCVLNSRTTSPQWGIRAEEGVASAKDRLVRDVQLEVLVSIKSISRWSGTDHDIACS